MAGGSTDAALKYGTFDGRVVKSSARIKLLSSPVTVGQQQQLEQQSLQQRPIGSIQTRDTQQDNRQVI